MNTVSLGDVADFVNGVAFKPEDWHETGLPIIRIQNLTDPNKPINLTNRKVADKYRVRRGDILVSWSATLGVFTWDRTDEALVNQHIFRVVPNTAAVEPGYLKHILQGALLSMERHLHGATIKHVNRAEFLGTQIPLPPLDEQCRIAAILDQADAMRAKRRRTVALLGELLKSTFVSTCPFDAEIPWLSLGESVARVIDYRGKSPTKSLTGVPLVTAGLIKNQAILPPREFIAEADYGPWMRRGLPQKGDVSFTSEAPLGEVASVADEHIALAQRIILLRGKPGLIDGQYLMHALMSPLVQADIARRSTGSTVRGIRQSELLKVSIPVPPLDVQGEFAVRASALEGQRSKHEESFQAMNSLFGALQLNAFSGQL